jgi:hypothetical protein
VIIATDRISAFDYILPTGIPDKGKVLTQLSIFWFDFLRDLTPTHFLSANVDEYPQPLPNFRGQLEGRSMLVKRAQMIEIECVARGYLSGSGWKEYKQQGTVCGIRLPAGLKESDKLPEPIFTPATKAQTGHDENVSFETVVSLIGEDLARRLRDLTLNIYSRAAKYAETAASSSPTPSSNSASWATNWCWATKCSRPIRRASGRPKAISPAERSSPSTSNSCATTWNRFTGTSSRPRRRCRRKSPRAPAKSIARPTKFSPAANYELAGRCPAADHRLVGDRQL